MYWCTDLLFVIMMLMPEGVPVNIDAKVTVVMQNAEEFRSLEVCTSRNQQRLGNVYNMTRHHKKVHKRRTTTTTPMATTLSELLTTMADSTTEFTLYQTKPPRLHRPVRHITEYDNDYLEDVHRIDNILEEELQINNHYKKNKRLNDEVLQELNVNGLSTSRNKVKKMYRDSAVSAVNKISKNSKNGIFLTENCTTVIAQIGTTAVLHCEVSDITENTVTWIRKKDYSLLSVGLVTYSADNRFFSAHGRHVKDWALHIRFATSADAGYYECQVPTHPPTSLFFKLALVAAYAEIMGESEKIIHEGSMLRLVCVVRRSTEPPTYVFWYFENRMINYDLNGVSVHNGRQTSELVIGRALPRHAGNYTCVPANAKSASVTVHVVQSETPAAMQHGNNSASETSINFVVVLLLLSAILNLYSFDEAVF